VGSEMLLLMYVRAGQFQARSSQTSMPTL
jgi:hypothetical protein